MLHRLGHSKLAPRLRRGFRRWSRRPAIRKIAIGLGAAAFAFTVAVTGLWWRLNSGPISLNLLTPWFAAAVAENFGRRYQVEIGGTVIELDENSRMAVRMRDIVLRDDDGTIVATAPKAEAGFSTVSLLLGRPRVESINLVGAELALRVQTDGKITIFAGADKRPIAVSPVLASAEPAAPAIKAGDVSPTPVPAVANSGASFAA
ncbi:MAG: hypothetical protein ACXWVB_07370, partial [Rhodoplanes sp.]